MKNTTYITLGTLILIPFIFILLFLVPEKELSDVFNLTKMADRKLKMVHNVVFDGRIDLLDSANVQLQLVIVPDTTGNGCSVNYPSEVFKVVQIGNTLRIRVSDEGKSLLRKNLRLLQNADMNKIDPDTIYSSDTLKIKLLADRGLENINLKYEHEIVLEGAKLPELTVRTPGVITLSTGTEIGRLRIVGHPTLHLYNSKAGNIFYRLIPGDENESGALYGENYRIGTLTIAGNGYMTGIDAAKCDHLIIDPDRGKDGGLNVSFDEVKALWKVK